MPVQARHKTDSLAHKSDSVPVMHYTQYITTTTMFRDFHLINRNSKLIQRTKWLRNLFRSIGATDTLNIPCSTDQRIVRITRPAGARKDYQDILGINREQLNEMFNTGDLMTYFVSRRLRDSVATDTLIKLRKRKVLGQMQIHRTTLCCDTTYDTIPRSTLRLRPRLRYSGMVEYRKPRFWARYDSLLYYKLHKEYIDDSLDCHTSITDSAGVYHHAQSSMQEDACSILDYSVVRYGWGMKFLTLPLKAFINNYIEVGKKPVFEISPIVSLFSVNTEDGFRLRFGGRTTANLFKRVFMTGYLAYGFKSQHVYGLAKALYSFVNKNYEENEFPRRSISVTYRNDICSLGERNMHEDHDNLFKSYEWATNAKMMFFNLQKVEFQWDLDNGIGFLAGIRREEDSSNSQMQFHSLADIRIDQLMQELGFGTIFTDNGSICTNELRLEVMYTPPTKRFQARKNIAPDNLELPSMGITHNFGLKMWGGQYRFHLSEVRILKDWYLGRLGTAHSTFRAGYLWNKVPFPMLLAPAANISYISDYDSFGLLYKSEFLNDRYIQLNLSLETNGNLIGLIPFMKRLRWKEFAGVRMLLGSLSDKNNPTLAQNAVDPILMPMPANTYAMDGTKPYVECVVGIHDILRIFNIDYIFRCTYRDILTSSNSGVRFSVHF